MIDEGHECSINCKSSLSKAPYMLAIRTLFRLENVPAPAKLVQSFSAAPFAGRKEMRSRIPRLGLAATFEKRHLLLYWRNTVKTYYAEPNEVEREWLLIDAEDQVLGPRRFEGRSYSQG